MFTYKKASYKIFALGPKFCWAGPGCRLTLRLIVLVAGCPELLRLYHNPQKSMSCSFHVHGLCQKLPPLGEW